MEDQSCSANSSSDPLSCQLTGDMSLSNPVATDHQHVLVCSSQQNAHAPHEAVPRGRIPNGFVSYLKHETKDGEVPCECKKSGNDINSLMSDQGRQMTDIDTTKLCLPDSSSHEHLKRQNEYLDSVDSGVQSGTDNGSDSKSSTSSPGLSTESSVQDLSDKTDIKKCSSDEPLVTGFSVKESTESEVVDRLAESVSKNVAISCENQEPEVDIENGIEYVVYENELQMPDIMRLITKDLSEPYSIYTYRYFIHNWPKLCFLACEEGRFVGAIVCKLDMHKRLVRRGYIAMLAVDQANRRQGIGSHLVLKAIRAMIADDCDEVVLETEITNKAALRLYENLGFVRDKRLFRYYLNGVDALRLKLWLR